MKKLLILSSLCHISLTFQCFSPLAMATEIAFEPKVTTGFMHHKYQHQEQEIEKNTRADNMPFIGAGLTAYYGKFFVDGYFQQSDRGVNEEIIEISTPITYLTTVSFKRQDYAMTLGYNFDKVVVFGGYKFGETEAQNTRFPPPSPNLLSNNDSFKTQGPFLGIAYGWRPFGSGVFGISVAAAALTAKYNEIHDQAIGWTTAATWNAPITNKLSYSLSVNHYQYETDEIERVAYGRTFSIQENITAFQTSLVYSFEW